MAITILPQDQRQVGLEQALGMGLQNLASGFVQKRQAAKQQEQQRMQLDALSDQLGLSEEEKSTFANLSPDVAKAISVERVKGQEKGRQRKELFNSLFPDRASPVEFEESDISETQVFPETGQPREFSDEQIVAISIADPKVGKVLQEQKKIKAKETLEQRKVVADSFKQSKEFRKETSSKFRDTKLTQTRLNRMKQLNAEGNLTSAATATMLDKVGLPIGVLNKPDSEEFDKLSKDLLKDVRTFFPGRINVVEVENFLKTIPSLMNSQKGRERVANNLLRLSQPNILAFDAMRSIQEEASATGEPLPLDFQEKIEEILSPQLDQLAQDFLSQTGQLIVGAPTQTQFESLPPPADFPGSEIEDDRTGITYRSDGNSWRKI